MAQDKSKWFQGDTTFEEIEVGMSFADVETDRLSTIIDKTSNSVRVFNPKDLRLKETKTEGGKFKGIDSCNWYNLDTFNRKYKKI